MSGITNPQSIALVGDGMILLGLIILLLTIIFLLLQGNRFVPAGYKDITKLSGGK